MNYLQKIDKLSLAIGLSAFIALRSGLFGKSKVHISNNDIKASTSNYLLFDRAIWEDQDTGMTVRHFSFKPIQFHN